MNTNTNMAYQQGPNLEAHEAEDGLIVFNSVTDKVHHLNPSAGVLFELCGKPSTASQLAEQLQALYELDAAPVDEVSSALADLLEQGVLVSDSGA